MKIRMAMVRGQRKWLLDSRKNGTGRRRYFATRAEAEAAAGGELKALEEIAAAGLTVEEIWQHWQQNRVRISMKVADAIDQCLRDREAEGRRETYLRELRRFLHQVFGANLRLETRDIDWGDIHEWMMTRPVSRATVAGDIGKLRSFSRWLHGRGLVAEDPIDRWPRVTWDPAAPAVLSESALSRVLSVACRVDTTLVPEIALRGICGVRRGELDRMSWDAIDMTRRLVVIDSAASKTRRRRLVPIPDNAFDYLRIGGEIPAVNRRRRMLAVQEAAGVEIPQNALRHTAASHWYEHLGLDATVKAMGHSETILHRHYRALLGPEENIFRIFPLGQPLSDPRWHSVARELDLEAAGDARKKILHYIAGGHTPDSQTY